MTCSVWLSHINLSDFSYKTLLPHSPGWAGVLPGIKWWSLCPDRRKACHVKVIYYSSWSCFSLFVLGSKCKFHKSSHLKKNTVVVYWNRQIKSSLQGQKSTCKRKPTLNGPPFPSSSSRMYPSTAMVESGGCFHDNVALLFWVQHSSSWSMGAAGTKKGKNEARLQRTEVWRDKQWFLKKYQALCLCTFHLYKVQLVDCLQERSTVQSEVKVTGHPGG